MATLPLKLRKIWNKTNLEIRLPTSDVNFSFIPVWNHKVMALNGKLFSCSFPLTVISSTTQSGIIA